MATYEVTFYSPEFRQITWTFTATTKRDAIDKAREEYTLMTGATLSLASFEVTKLTK